MLEQSEKIIVDIESLTTDEILLKSFEDEHTTIEGWYFTINERIKKISKQHSNPPVKLRWNQTNYETIIDDSELNDSARNLQPSGVQESLVTLDTGYL